MYILQNIKPLAAATALLVSLLHPGERAGNTYFISKSFQHNSPSQQNTLSKLASDTYFGCHGKHCLSLTYFSAVLFSIFVTVILQIHKFELNIERMLHTRFSTEIIRTNLKRTMIYLRVPAFFV